MTSVRTFRGAVLVVFAAGLAVTALLASTAWLLDRGNEDRLLEQRVREAGAVLQAVVPSIQSPLAAGAEVAAEGDVEHFERIFAAQVGPGRAFASASLWPLDGDATAPSYVLGAAPVLAAQPPATIRAVMAQSMGNQQLSVHGPLRSGGEQRLGYSFVSSQTTSRYMAYAEAALTPERVTEVDPASPFGGLHYAMYLGPAEDPNRLLQTSTTDLPIGGRVAAEQVPFGDSSLLLVMAPIGHQGGAVLQILPALLAAGGVGLTVLASWLVGRVLASRAEAQRLARQNAVLFEEQRQVASTLQHSMLPSTLPSPDGAELAFRYLPGVKSMEVGGDWYDALVLDEGRVLLLIGDVSGRGLRAASVMASLRFTARAFAGQGDDPATVLAKLNELTAIDADGQFATVACALVDLGAGTVTVANAGHPRPLLLDAEGGRFLTTVTGPPVGIVSSTRYEQCTHPIGPTGTLVLFTDGLMERRNETLDIGMERLRQAAVQPAERLDELLDGLLERLVGHGVDDDVAILALRWDGTPAGMEPTPSEAAAAASS
ncbi:MAG: PP2C family protein-serine/threonine phosphatase [Acidimicrobiia bacterium]